jgi:2-hydroxychromene-2-carboxylate isomerase
MPGAKRDYVMRDLERRAERMTVPYFFPSRFPMNTVKALRLTLAADAVQRPALVDALFRALWVDDKDISDTDQLQRIAASCGALDALRRIENPEIKQALFSATDEAKARGVFGVPTFVARNELFFGQDRLHQVERALLGY